ncbi:aminopeptidase N [Kitasatospora acidiphila]|uniref:Aminopeptidase N n=1 Tax=Kitasatospora acidiphila TaxID=2567942 RepID=A0A540VXB9_9ACTN|nr:aminopeptidase N [Kitasatospora acidiphila]TQF01410.1 aminopeptidase N [Kitasatospora acidiphila]
MTSLTKAEASHRTSAISVGGYQVTLDLAGTAEVFRSTTAIRFTAAQPDAEVFFELRPALLHEVTLNGTPLDVALLSDGRFPLTGLAGENELTVVADMPYSRSNEGLHRFTDPADGQVYVYGFPYADQAPRIFACFDQPDLKAPFVFTVTTPEHWQVLSTAEASQTAPGQWKIGPTAPQATYLTTIAAGPYASFTSDHDGIRLGLHCRASLAEAMKADVAELFDVTRRCLDESHRLFGVRYPLPKFDQMFVPEFSVISLDHPGLVLLREQWLFNSAAPDSERETRAVILAHGISLMWMAGLVTNAWWDELWLGQAFADYLAHRIPSEVTRFTGPPTTFAARRKGQAYDADQRPSTHPVSVAGESVAAALLDLDRISYFKGHSALRQLSAAIGDDALRAGLRLFFERHAHGTATYKDFLDALSEAARQDLTHWSDTWLKSANVNTLWPELETADGVITAAAIRQSAPQTHPVLRRHTLDIGLYDAAGTRTALVRTVVDGARTPVPELAGLPEPALLLLNDGDLTYAKIRLDERSQQALPGLLAGLAPINRAMLWCQLLLAVKDGAYPAAAHLALVADMVRVEPELSILTEVLEQARFQVADTLLDPAERPAAVAAIADALRGRLATTGPDAEEALTLFRGLIDFTPDAAELASWLGPVELPAGLALDTDLAWRIRLRLTALGGLGAAEIEAAQAADPGSDGALGALKCRAALPDPAAKEAAWNALLAPGDLSNFEVFALAGGFWQPEQEELTAPYVVRFFEELPAVAGKQGDLVLDLLVKALYPKHSARPETVRLARALLDSGQLPESLRRAAADLTDDLARAAAVR